MLNTTESNVSPFKEIWTNQKSIILAVSDMLEHLCDRNTEVMPYACRRRNSRRLGSLSDQIKDLFSACKTFTIPCLVCATIYIMDLDPVMVTYNTIPDLFHTSLMIACKYLEDDNVKNSFFAKYVGVSLGTINRLERDFLKNFCYDMSVSEERFKSTLDFLRGSQ